MTRIIAGSAGGRRLEVPAGRGTRPTTDRVREALFSALGELAGARVLDLYAGSGAVGLEALSRGAAHALLVERDPRALRALRANVAALGLPGAVVAPLDAAAALAGACPGDPYDLAFLDPPYGTGVEEVLARLAAGGWLAPGCDVVVERPSRAEALDWPAGMVARQVRRYGETSLWYGRRS